MTTINDFAENNPLSAGIAPLSYENIYEYKKANGLKATQGYMEAISDIVKELDTILYIRGETAYLPHTPANIKRELTKFLKEKEDFLALVRDNRPKWVSTPKPF